MPLSSSFGLPPQMEARFREHGYNFSPDIISLSRSLFAESTDHSLPPGGVMHRDIRYGAHDRQMLDICTPGRSHAPVVIYVPGGGMTSGDKGLYAHVAAFFARQGFVGATVNYRLAPEFLFPSGAQDVAGAIDWLVDHATEFGGDPDRIYLIGQSAGAVHCASTIFDDRARPRHLDRLRTAVLMSGVYKVTPDFENANMNLYFGNSAAELEDRCPIYHAGNGTVPVIITAAEYEPGFFGRSAGALIEALTMRDGHAPQFLWLKGHNHLSPVLHLGSATDELGLALADAFRATPS